MSADFSALMAISPVDGRYRGKTEPLAPFFSEFGLIRYRIRIEIEYFIALGEIPLPQIPPLQEETKEKLRDLYLRFSPEEALKIKEIEKITNHDVKAVEYFLKKKFDSLGYSHLKEFIHFGLTSQDINNTAIPLSFREAVQEQYLPVLGKIASTILNKAETWPEPMDNRLLLPVWEKR